MPSPVGSQRSAQTATYRRRAARSPGGSVMSGIKGGVTGGVTG
ncbi:MULTISPECIES: hypothetical protein [Streptomyces]|uniref:Uncharacterized protein n=2 Tax=Streptomyces TaxID=1883 RepID=A0AA89Q4S7_STRCU|nr:MULTISPECIES: hypothetical protein [Streptomyces]MBB5810351.1 hypothetical protein [Streptomyces collinus]MEC7053245.1 hypothetical protein [Streptomyces violaceochromogenes]WMX69543.1 hypothetical protein RFN52_09860 [Streptomyces collinus]